MRTINASCGALTGPTTTGLRDANWNPKKKLANPMEINYLFNAEIGEIKANILDTSTRGLSPCALPSPVFAGNVSFFFSLPAGLTAATRKKTRETPRRRKSECVNQEMVCQGHRPPVRPYTHQHREQSLFGEYQLPDSPMAGNNLMGGEPISPAQNLAEYKPMQEWEPVCPNLAPDLRPVSAAGCPVCQAGGGLF